MYCSIRTQSSPTARASCSLFSGGNFGLNICFLFCKLGEIAFCHKNYYEDFTRALRRLCFNTFKAISLVKNILQTCMVFVNSVLYNVVVNQKDVQHVRYGASFIKKMKNEASMEWGQLQKDQPVCAILWVAQQPDPDVRTLLSALLPFPLRSGRWLWSPVYYILTVVLFQPLLPELVHMVLRLYHVIEGNSQLLG